jgi:hypothetical protein
MAQALQISPRQTLAITVELRIEYFATTHLVLPSRGQIATACQFFLQSRRQRFIVPIIRSTQTVVILIDQITQLATLTITQRQKTVFVPAIV